MWCDPTIPLDQAKFFKFQPLAAAKGNCGSQGPPAPLEVGKKFLKLLEKHIKNFLPAAPFGTADTQFPIVI